MLHLQSYPTQPSAGVLLSSAGFTEQLDYSAALEVQNLSVEQYMDQLCRLIARASANCAVRDDYERMLSQLRAMRDLA